MKNKPKITINVHIDGSSLITLLGEKLLSKLTDALTDLKTTVEAGDQKIADAIQRVADADTSPVDLQLIADIDASVKQQQDDIETIAATKPPTP